MAIKVGDKLPGGTLTEMIETEQPGCVVAVAEHDLPDPAQPRAGFKQRDPDWSTQFLAALQEPVRRGQTGNAAADDYHVLHIIVGSVELGSFV